MFCDDNATCPYLGKITIRRHVSIRGRRSNAHTHKGQVATVFASLVVSGFLATRCTFVIHHSYENGRYSNRSMFDGIRYDQLFLEVYVLNLTVFDVGSVFLLSKSCSRLVRFSRMIRIMFVLSAGMFMW